MTDSLPVMIFLRVASSGVGWASMAASLRRRSVTNEESGFKFGFKQGMGVPLPPTSALNATAAAARSRSAGRAEAAAAAAAVRSVCRRSP